MMTSSRQSDDAKAAMRREALVRRDGLSADARRAAAALLAARPLPLPLAADTVVSGFMAINTEIDPAPLMRKLSERGARLALPVVIGPRQPLTMRAWHFGAPLSNGVWGIREPTPDAAEVEPDIVLVPLLAFDRSGRRLGYGGGYYDRTIARLRARKTVIAIGLAYAIQEVNSVPSTSRDAPLDLVLTERETIDLRGA